MAIIKVLRQHPRREFLVVPWQTRLTWPELGPRQELGKIHVISLTTTPARRDGRQRCALGYRTPQEAMDEYLEMKAAA
jgi:hypothetical protein